MIWIVIAISIIIFIPFYNSLGKEWYGPYGVFFLPFLACYVVAGMNSTKWNFDLSVNTSMALIIGEIAFLLGCYVAKRIVINKRTSFTRMHLFELRGEGNSIRNSNLVTLLLIETGLFVAYLVMVYLWGVRHGCDIFTAINKIMLNGKFGGDGDPLGLPFILQIFLQMNYIAGYFFAYLIARRVILKEKTNLLLLNIGYIVSILTNFLGGSRGPILEILTALLISFGIVYFFKTNRRSFSFKHILLVLTTIVITGVLFFSILPLMGRSQTAKDESDVFTQYIGSQIYNLNYYIENVDKHSSFFCAETLKSFYHDIETFLGVDIGYQDGMIGNFFVFDAYGHDLGNVFTTYYNFYIDFGYFGVFIFTFFMGWISEKYFLTVKFNQNLINYRLIIYIYMAASIAFSFFASRFFQNVVQLKMLLKIFWIIFMYLYLVNGSYLLININGKKKISFHN